MNSSTHDLQTLVHLNDRWSQFHCHVFKTTSGRTDDTLTYIKTHGNVINRSAETPQEKSAVLMLHAAHIKNSMGTPLMLTPLNFCAVVD